MKRTIMLVAGLATVLSACGGDAVSTEPSSDPSRSIDVTMVDNAFDPVAIDVAAGETIMFTFRNKGSVRHEALFGDLAQQEAHHAEMAEMGGDHDMGSMDMGSMEMGSMDHDAESMAELHVVMVEPGQSIEVSHTFATAGQMLLGCHEPGHWEAGMKVEITVG